MKTLNTIFKLLFFNSIVVFLTATIPFVVFVVCSCFSERKDVHTSIAIVVINIIWMISVFLVTFIFKNWINNVKHIVINCILFFILLSSLLLLFLVIPNTREQFMLSLLDLKSEQISFWVSATMTMIFLNNGSTSALSVVMGPLLLVIKFTVAHITGFLLSKRIKQGTVPCIDVVSK